MDKWERINKFINSSLCCYVTNSTVGSSRLARNEVIYLLIPCCFGKSLWLVGVVFNLHILEQTLNKTNRSAQRDRRADIISVVCVRFAAVSMFFYLSSTFSQLACLYGRELAPVRILQNAAIQFYLDLGSPTALLRS